MVAGVAVEGRSNNRVQSGGGRGEGVCLGFFPFWPENAQTFFSACLTLGLPQVRGVRSKITAIWELPALPEFSATWVTLH